MIEELIKATSIDAAREKLHAELAGKSEYDWADVVLEQTTANFIDKALDDQPALPAGRSPLPVNHISEHLSQAGRLLDECIDRQDRLYELEAACISAVIDSLNIERQIDLDEQLEVVAATASARLANLPIEPGVEAARSKADLRRDTFRFRRNFYSQPGGALNFNERVTFLRELQADGVRDTLECAMALRAGLDVIGLTSLPEVPRWNMPGMAPFKSLVDWLHQASRAMTAAVGNERIYTLVLSTKSQKDKFVGKDGKPLPDEGPFFPLPTYVLNLTKSSLKNLVASNQPFKSMRLLSMSVGIVMGGDKYSKDIIGFPDYEGSSQTSRDWRFAVDAYLRRWRSEQRGEVKIRIPEQKGLLQDGTAFAWQPGEVAPGPVVGIAESVDQDSLTPLPADRVINLAMEGKWEFDIQPVLRNTREFPWMGERPDWQLNEGRFIGGQLQVWSFHSPWPTRFDPGLD